MESPARSALGLPTGAPPQRDRPISTVATLSGRATAADALERLAPDVQCLEVRADLTEGIDPRSLRGRFPGGLLYTLRSTAEGGGCDDPPDRRRERLIAAADDYDFVDLEAVRDLHPAVLGRIAPDRRVISWHGPAADLADLHRKFDALATVPARLYRLVPRADTLAQALLPLLLLKSIARRDVVAYGHGPAATWTRVLTARYGAPVAFGRLADHRPEVNARAQADGELLLRRLLSDYPHQLLLGAERLYGTIGGSTAMSLIPLAHNTAYQALGIPALFLAFSTDELTRSLEDLRTGLDKLGLPLHATGAVAPHKDTALTLATEATPLARRAGAASLLVRTRSGWWGDIEAAGVVGTMSQNGVEIAGRRIAVIGCGGAGRAAAAGLSRAGGQVTLVNRGMPGGLRAAKLLGLPFVPLREFDPHRYSVLINATPVKDAMPFSIDGLDPATVIFDLSYGITETPLVTAARAAGHPTIDGTKMTQVELPRQFHLMTGRHITLDTVRAAQNEFRRNFNWNANTRDQTHWHHGHPNTGRFPRLSDPPARAAQPASSRGLGTAAGDDA